MNKEEYARLKLGPPLKNCLIPVQRVAEIFGQSGGRKKKKNPPFFFYWGGGGKKF